MREPYAVLGGGRQPTVTLYHGDSLAVLPQLVPGRVHCVMTSPPYWGLRDYQLGDGGLGLEPVPFCPGWERGPRCNVCYVCRLVGVFEAVHRVLRDDGVLWLNLGTTMQEKQDLGLPWRVALALQASGWWLRSECLWHKLNPLPESVQDRPTKAHEQVFLLTKQPRYWYDHVAVQEPAVKGAAGSRFDVGKTGVNGHGRTQEGYRDAQPEMRALRSVWSIASEPTPFAHFATFPTALVRRCLLAGCPAQVCSTCGAPYVRQVEHGAPTKSTTRGTQPWTAVTGQRDNAGGLPLRPTLTTGFTPTCACAPGAGTSPGVCLDPFAGSGTTNLVAVQEGRHSIGVDLNPQYLALAVQRLTPALRQLPLFEVPHGR